MELRGLVCLALAVSVTAMHIAKPSDGVEMQSYSPEGLEFPSPADDSVAGSPGSATEMPSTGPAHAVPHETLELPCDMNSEDESPSPVEQERANSETPFTPAPPLDVPVSEQDEHDQIQEEEEEERVTHTPVPSTPKRVSGGMFTCRTGQPEVDPRLTSPYDIDEAQDEGNDNNGLSSTDEFTVTSCACTCSSANPECGVVGSLIYFSRVPSSAACAQLICHENKFSSCLWKSKVVSSGVWDGMKVSFNSTSLTPLVGQSHNATRGAVAVSPSPSPSPSHVPPRSERVVLEAVARLADLKAGACLSLSPAVIPQVLAHLERIDMSEPPAVSCAVEEAEESNLGEDITDIKQSDEAIENALAGYDERSPLAADRTRHAALSMNFIEIAEGGDVELEGFALLVRLFQNSIPFAAQCEGNTPTMETLLRSGDRLPLCDVHREQYAGEVVGSALDLYLRLFAALRAQFVPMAPELTAPEAEAFNPDMPDEDWSADQFDPSSMQSPKQTEDCEDTPAAANEARVEDSQGRAPGARAAEPVDSAATSESLPEFGKQSLTWGKREGATVVLTQPAENK